MKHSPYNDADKFAGYFCIHIEFLIANFNCESHVITSENDKMNKSKTRVFQDKPLK